MLGVAEELSGSLIPGVQDLPGRGDSVTEIDETSAITNLKTSPSRWRDDQAEDSSEQLSR